MFKTIKTKRMIIGMAVLAAAILAGMAILAIRDVYLDANMHYYPDYPEMELSEILDRAELGSQGWRFDEQDYEDLFYQTGLGRPAIDALMLRRTLSAPEALSILESYQRDFFAQVPVTCTKIGIITYEEKVTDENGSPIKGFQLAPLEIGDIFISKSTHSLGWRHGHSAIVIDSQNKKTLEAILLGYDSIRQSADKWQKYPTFMVLRLKDSGTANASDVSDSADVAAKAAEAAKTYMEGVPYGLLTGMGQKAPAPEDLEKTQCAHLVWYPYMLGGHDLDSDGGWLVTPQDIADSPDLEVVQIYGVDPASVWER